ncbi:MAG: hypothetical protein VSS75_004760 [Candidatus Parabeggiatoa sp.]|nr:hypothetical protein [Candidatus Parabeggiatoa sp.]
MLAYRQQIIIENPEHIVLSNLPFRVGQEVEVLILPKEDIIEKTPRVSHKSTQVRHEEAFSKQTLSDSNQVINPAQAYTDTEWDKLEPDLRSELETQYVLNNPILMDQIRDQSEWFTVSLEQLGIDLEA